MMRFIPKKFFVKIILYYLGGDNYDDERYGHVPYESIWRLILGGIRLMDLCGKGLPRMAIVIKDWSTFECGWIYDNIVLIRTIQTKKIYNE